MRTTKTYAIHRPVAVKKYVVEDLGGHHQDIVTLKLSSPRSSIPSVHAEFSPIASHFQRRSILKNLGLLRYQGNFGNQKYDLNPIVFQCYDTTRHFDRARSPSCLYSLALPQSI